MMKKILLTGLILLTAAVSVQGAEFDSEKFLLKMDLPAGFVYKSAKKGRWLVYDGYEKSSNTRLVIYAYTGKTTKKKIYDFGIKESGVPESGWKLTDSSGGDGFEWWERYEASDASQTLFAIIGKNASSEIYYLAFILTPTETLEKYAGEYRQWLESIEAIPGNKIFSGKFKIVMTLPPGFVYELREKGKWGVLDAFDPGSKTRVVSYAFTGKTTRKEIYAFGARESGIPEKKWELADEGEKEAGFEWFEIFTAEGKKENLYALIGKNDSHDVYYLTFILTPPQNVKKYEDEYWKWLESVEGLE